MKRVFPVSGLKKMPSIMKCPALNFSWCRSALYCAALFPLVFAPVMVRGQNVFESFAGQLLAASPRQTDEVFSNTVIFMLEHDLSGATGLIVNRPINAVNISQLYRLLEFEPETATETGLEVQLFFGGPDQPETMLMLHETVTAIAESQVINSDYVISGWASFLRRVEATGIPPRAIFTLGLVQWAPGQLEREIIAGAWTSHEANPDELFGNDPLGLWGRVLAGQNSKL